MVEEESEIILCHLGGVELGGSDEGGSRRNLYFRTQII